jgi:hypothetical protein
MINPNQNLALACRRRNNLSSAGFYTNIDPGISVRPPMDRNTYEYFRPNESIPDGNTQEDDRRIMSLCKAAYQRVGVIKSVVDMMSEFAAEGIEILHPDEEPNTFYKAWSKRINIEDRAERFLNWLYKSGNVAVRRNYGTIPTADLRKLSKELNDIPSNYDGGRIPLEYLFYDPSTLELIGGRVGALSNRKIYAIRINPSLLDGIRSPRNDLERQVYNAIPQEVKNALEGKNLLNSMMLVPLPEDKVFIGHYKKDDSDVWAKSFIYSILDDIFYNDKLKLAKTSALDGWYNVIRLWKLGDHVHNIQAAPDAGLKLESILQANTGGGASDIIWSSDISLEEFYPPIEKLVNFEENMHAILLGLGVPEGLVGGKAQGSAGMTSNYLGLKNLIKRLEAGRREVIRWLDGEIDIIQKELKFKKRPVIRFSNNDLHDERTYYNLLVQLLDRNVISDQTVLERIDEIPEIEISRIQKETALRDTDQIPDKAGPYHRPDLELQQKHELKKIRLQQELINENTDNSNNLMKKVPKREKLGRPSNSPDKVTRKRSPNKVKSPRGAVLIEASRIYNIIDSFLRKNALHVYSVDNIRKLSAAQEIEIDQLRLIYLGMIDPFTLNDENDILSLSEDYINSEFEEYYKTLLSEASSESLNANDKYILRINAYADFWSEGV